MIIRVKHVILIVLRSFVSVASGRTECEFGTRR